MNNLKFPKLNANAMMVIYNSAFGRNDTLWNLPQAPPVIIIAGAVMPAFCPCCECRFEPGHPLAVHEPEDHG